MKPICSIVIRAFNEEKHIGRLLEGIRVQTIKDVQVILVDSGSTDKTMEIARRLPVEIVKIQPQDFSFGRSLNLGIAHTKAPIVVIASAHVYPVYPDWLEKLIEPFSEERTALVYGKQRGNSTSQFSEHQIFAQWFPDHSVATQTTPFCNNANAAVRRSIWEMHPYNETLPALEDMAWGRWVLEQGYRIAYTAEAEIIHVHSETWQSIANRYRREGMAFKHIYPQEHFHWWDLFRLFFANVAHDRRIAREQGVLGREWNNINHFRWAQFWGTYLGYHQSGPLTWKLKQAFYYPRTVQPVNTPDRQIEPIQYHEMEDK
ncbi:MAG TPA: glycosyltransferase family A protein [Longilinea sp.]|nr:glycosyltransferase family A protein [Longilinea sp.]